jgi:uncharacterized protein YbjT (DUF2867 family)
MDEFGDGANAIIAGASGLVGACLLERLLNASSIASVTTLVRQPLAVQHEKLHQIQNSHLEITDWDENKASPDLGFICLGTTRKQAGSKLALERIDVDLVCQVAQTMRMLGVRRVAVISSYGASPSSLSHYLKCKGRMEQNILKMDFERVVFVRPGPLVGERVTPRTDELIAQRVLSVIGPLLVGSLANLRPIKDSTVAKAMLFALVKPKHHPSDSYRTLNTVDINQMLASYDVTVD